MERYRDPLQSARRSALQDRFRAALQAHAFAAAPGIEFSVLALSGGGQWGAFGAGFLKGWSARRIPPLRPVFNVVTGTSTGALIATFAFLGSSEDDTIGNAYLTISGDADVFTKRFPLALLWSDSATTRDQFRKRLEGVITNETLINVAKEGAKGRCLFVGATDILGGEFHALDLTEIAGSVTTIGPTKARQAYIDALMASTAIPVQFPLVTLSGTDPSQPGTPITYVDGGVRRNIFVDALVDASKASGRAVQSAIYCLVNGTRDVDPIAAISGFPKLLTIARRSTDILLNESTEGNLFRIYLQAQQHGIRFQVTAVPPQVAKKCRLRASQQDQAFEPKLMRCLNEEGIAFAQNDPQPWDSDPLVGSP